MSPRIVGLGTCAVDDLLHVAEYPPADGKAPILRKGRASGGQVATALAAAARLGCATSYAATLGEDDLSRFLLASCHSLGIGTDRVVNRPGARPIHSVIIADDTHGTRAIFFERVGVQTFPLDSIREDLLLGADVLLMDQLGEEACLRAASIAHALGIPVVGDFEWEDRPRIADLLAATDHLLVSRDFAFALTGHERPEAAAHELHRRCPRACTAVTCGKDGCHYVAGNPAPAARHLPAFRVDTVSTTGCGDVFHGAYAAGIASKQPVPAALRFASATAALYASRPNGWEHLPTLAEVNALLQTQEDPP